MFGENYSTEIVVEEKPEVKTGKRVTIDDPRSRRSSSRHGGRSSRRDRSSRSKSKTDKSSKSKDKKSKDASKRDESGPKRTKSILKRPKGYQAKAIGKRLENSRYDYIDHLRDHSGNDKDYILTESQVYKLLDNARIRLTEQEKLDFIRDMGDSRFTVEDFLIN